MAKKLPEGLEEMAKDEDGIDRRDLEETYEELFEEIKTTSVDRRTVLRAFAGGGGLAVLNTLAAQKKYIGDDFEAGLGVVEDYSDDPMGVQRVDEAPYKVKDDEYERFDCTNTNFYVPLNEPIVKWIKEDGGNPIGFKSPHAGGVQTPENLNELIDSATISAGNSFGEKWGPIKAESPGMARAYFALGNAGMNLNLKVGPFFANQLKQPGAGPLVERPPDLDDPGKLTPMVKTAARLQGTSDVGVAELDKRWIYSVNYSYPMQVNPIEFRDVEKPMMEGDAGGGGDMDTDDGTLVLPNDMNRVVVGLVETPLKLVDMYPTAASSFATRWGYGLMGVIAEGVATFIRQMGYNAIPCMNDTGISVPMAIDAGLGQYGRHGFLIHPHLGSNGRIWKVLTDMPLNTDKPIVFGATEFCKGCKLCADNCPSQTITRGERTWKPVSPTPASWKKVTDLPYHSDNNPGVYKWYNDYKKCLRFWKENGGSCTACQSSCPYTEGRSWLHDIIRQVGGTSPSTSKTLADMSAMFGYEQPREPSALWETEFLPFGLEQDPALGGF